MRSVVFVALAAMMALLAACGGNATATRPILTAPAIVTPVVTITAATATPNPARVRSTGTVQDNSPTGRVVTIRTADSVWYIPWDMITLLDGPRGPIAPADLPIGATVAFEGDPDPLARTPTLRQATMRVQ